MKANQAAMLMSTTLSSLDMELAATLHVIGETLRREGIPLPSQTYTNLCEVGEIPPLTTKQFNWLLCYATQLNIMRIETFKAPSCLKYESMFEWGIMHATQVGEKL